MMLQKLKNLVGTVTLPEDVYVCSLGDYWVETYFIPNDRGNLGFSGYLTRDYSHPHNYRKIEQDFWGIWEESTCWLGVNTPLPKLEKVAGS